MISTWVGGMGPGLLAAILSTLAINVFLSPAGILETQYQNVPHVISFLITALLVGSWSEARRRAEQSLRKARSELENNVQERTASLRQMNQALQAEIIDHERSEEALRTNEYRLQTAIDAANIGLWDWDLASGHIIWLGHHGKLFGFGPGEYDGTYASFEKRIHPEDLEELNRVVQQAREEQCEYIHEYRVIWPDGSIHWIAGRGRFAYNQAGQPVRMNGVVLDITERKQAEEATKESEERLRLAFEAAKFGTGELDLQTNQSIFSSALQRVLGFAPGTFNPTFEGYVERVHPEDRDIVRQAVENGIAGQPNISVDYRIVWPDGSIHWVTSRAKVFYDVTGKATRIVGALMDISEQKHVEEALRISEQKLNEAERIAHIGYWERDYDADLITWSSETYRILGISPEEEVLTVARMREFVHPEDRQRVADAYDHAWSSGSRFNLEYRVVRPNSEVRFVHTQGKATYDESGQPRRIFGVVQDITERKQVEEALRRSESNFRTLADKSLQGIAIFQDQKIVYANMALSDILGYTIEELKSMSLEEITGHTHPVDRPIAMERIRQRLSGEELSQFVELRILRKDGATRWIQTFNNPIEYNGQPAILTANMDITERKQAEQDIRRYADKMETLVEISRAFVEAGLEYQSVLNTVARRTAELIGDSCAITLFSEDNQRAFPVAFHHPDSKALALMEEALLHIWQGGTDTERFQILLAGESIYLPVVDPEEYRSQSEPEFWPYLDAVGISSLLIVPLKTQARVIGTLGVTRDSQGDPYTRDDQILLQNIADRAAMSIQNAQLFRQVEGGREQLGALSRRLLEVQEAERRALTTELHDRVGQNLTGLSINLQNMKSLLSREAAQKLATKFDDAQALVEDTTRQIRDLMVELHLPELEDYGLAVALETYAERAASRGNLELVTKLPDLSPPPLPSDIRIALFRAAQEAFSNVLKHAEATRLEVSLGEDSGKIRLTVEDNGKGFAPNGALQKEAQTWGLKIMHERIESIGGKVEIKYRLRQGTRVTFEIERPT